MTENVGMLINRYCALARRQAEMHQNQHVRPKSGEPVVRLSDGTLYLVRPDGWRRVKR